MNNHKEFDLIILGAGIAGLSAADECVRSGYSCAVVDTVGPGSGASGAPLGLLNPATGSRAKRSWRAEEALSVTNELLNRLQNSQSNSIYSPNGVFRPAPDQEIAEKMRQQLDKTDWPPGWVEWLDQMDIQSRFPGIKNSFGGVWVPVASTVSLEAFVSALARDLTARGVHLQSNKPYRITAVNPWKISFTDSDIQSSRLLCATGYSLVADPDWQFLPLHGVKGQLLSLDLNEPFPLNCSISSRGYMAVLPANNSRITLGSTYQHSFTSVEPDKNLDAYLLSRQEGNWPLLKGNITTRHRWSGIRVTTPDRKPVAGGHPDIKGLYALGGLGSKGLMHGPIAAKFLIDHIFQGTGLPAEIDLRRFQ